MPFPMLKKINASLVSDEEYLPALLRLLDGAKESVHLLAFSFAIGSAAGKLNEASAPFLVAKKLAELSRKRGLPVRVYIEGERETAPRNDVTARYLEEHGIEVVHGATHAKGLCVDARHTLFGSTNLTQQSMMKNIETNLLFDDKSVAAGFLRYFAHLREGGRHGGIHLPPPLYADGDFHPMLLELINSAKKTLHFSIYFFDQREVEKALLRAHQRGVEITGFVHNHFAFAMPYVRRTRRTVERLRAGGLEHLHYGPTHLFSHSKWLVADRKFIALGTGNWLNEDIKTHPQLYVRLDDAALARRMIARLDRRILESITPDGAGRLAA